MVGGRRRPCRSWPSRIDERADDASTTAPRSATRLGGARRRGSDSPAPTRSRSARPASTGRWCGREDFERFAGLEATVEIDRPIDGRKRFAVGCVGSTDEHRGRAMRMPAPSASSRLPSIRRGQAGADRRACSAAGRAAAAAAGRSARKSSTMDTSSSLRPRGAAAGRRGGGAGEGHRARRGARGDGAGHPDGRPPQIWPGARDRRRDRPPDRRDPALPRCSRSPSRSRTRPRRSRSRTRSARIRRPQIGDHILDPLPPIDLGRIAAQTRQAGHRPAGARGRARAAVQRVQGPDRRDRRRRGQAGRARQRRWSISAGPRRSCAATSCFPREMFRAKDRIRAYIYDVRARAARAADLPVAHPSASSWPSCSSRRCRRSTTASSRSRPVARDPGSRAKIAVISKDSSIDPVGACVGMRGSRVQAVVGELRGEKIDIIPWSPDPATFVVNALAPGRGQQGRARRGQPSGSRSSCPTISCSLAIGRRGQNVRLASQLTGWDIDIVYRDRGSERRQRRVPRAARDVHGRAQRRGGDRPAAGDRGLRHGRGGGLCAARGAGRIEGFDEEMAPSCRSVRRAISTSRTRSWRSAGASWASAEDLAAIDGLTPAMLVTLGEAGVKTLEDLADLAGDELVELVARCASKRETSAGAIIMAARAHWFASRPRRPRRLRPGERRRRGRSIRPAAEDLSATARSGREPDGDGPLRRCVVTRERWAEGELVASSLVPTARLVPDLAGRLPGRGMWVTARAGYSGAGRGQAALCQGGAPAPDRGAARSGRRVGALLTRRCLDLVGLGAARRPGGRRLRAGAGGAVSGGVWRCCCQRRTAPPERAAKLMPRARRLPVGGAVLAAPSWPQSSGREWPCMSRWRRAASPSACARDCAAARRISAM